MDIDLSPLTSTLNTMVLYMATILVVPIIVALVTGFILIKLKIRRIIVCAKHGIKNYTGTDSPNVTLLKKMGGKYQHR